MTFPIFEGPIATDPAPLPLASEKRYIREEKGEIYWDFPLPEEKFDDHPEEIGRIMSQEEFDQRIKTEEGFEKEDRFVVFI